MKELIEEIHKEFEKNYNIRVLDTIELSGGNESDRKFTIRGYDIRE